MTKAQKLFAKIDKQATRNFERRQLKNLDKPMKIFISRREARILKLYTGSLLYLLGGFGIVRVK